MESINAELFVIKIITGGYDVSFSGIGPSLESESSRPQIRGCILMGILEVTHIHTFRQKY
jgi:hypothetical protein